MPKKDNDSQVVTPGAGDGAPSATASTVPEPITGFAEIVDLPDGSSYLVSHDNNGGITGAEKLPVVAGGAGSLTEHVGFAETVDLPDSSSYLVSHDNNGGITDAEKLPVVAGGAGSLTEHAGFAEIVEFLDGSSYLVSHDNNGRITGAAPTVASVASGFAGVRTPGGGAGTRGQSGGGFAR